jgi:integrase
MPKVKIPTVRFTLFSTKEPKKQTYITLYFHYRGQRLKYSTGEKVCPEAWDFTKQRAKASAKFPEGTDINTTLGDFERHTNAIFRETNFGHITPAEFAAELDRRMGFAPGPDDKPKVPTLFDFIENKFLPAKRTQPRGTWKVPQTVFGLLKQYAQERARALDYGGIDYAFFTDFKNWLFAEPRRHSTNYAAKVVDTLKQFMREAQRRDYHSKTDYQNFSIKKEKTTKIALSFDELEALYRLDLSGNNRLEKVRDLFLIGAYTGLRFSDFTRIRPEHIEEQGNGETILTITTQKTGQTVSIPLFPIPFALLRKYDYHPPRISNQKMNDYLKELGQLAGMTGKMIVSNTAGGKRSEQVLEKWEKLTTHVARRSFATNFYRAGIPAVVLMKITGHATEQQFMQYISIDGKMNALHFADLRKESNHLVKAS